MGIDDTDDDGDEDHNHLYIERERKQCSRSISAAKYLRFPAVPRSVLHSTSAGLFRVGTAAAPQVGRTNSAGALGYTPQARAGRERVLMGS